jgi:hypothetical protein
VHGAILHARTDLVSRKPNPRSLIEKHQRHGTDLVLFISSMNCFQEPHPQSDAMLRGETEFLESGAFPKRFA